MRKTLLLFLSLLFSVLSFGKDRTSAEALVLAKQFLDNSKQVSLRSSVEPQLVGTSSSLLDADVSTRGAVAPSFYVFNSGERFVIVSGDDRMQPILGYSDAGSFSVESLPENMLSWLKFYDAERLLLDSEQSQPITAIKASTNLLKSYPQAIAPLLGSINWDQGSPYNDLCPVMTNGTKTASGCVATAMAMVMKYHNYPLTGKGTKSYTSSSLKLQGSFDFGKTQFDWDNMLPEYVQGNYNAEQAKAVAELMYGCGVAISMDYGPQSGASAAIVADAMIDFFSYDSNIKYLLREYFSYSEWMGMIKKELSEGRPILYNGASLDVGHEFVFDGYDENDMIHVNWGWSGINNGYFTVTSLNPETPGIGGGSNLGGGYIFQQGMAIGIQKPTAESVYQSYFSCDEVYIPSYSINKGDEFPAYIDYVFNMSTMFNKGDIALVLEKDGVQTVLASSPISSIPTFNGWYEYNFSSDLTFPTSISDGKYIFYAATKDSNKETSWSPIRGAIGSKTKYYVTVTGNNVEFSDFWPMPEISSTLEVLHNLYTKRTGTFLLSVDNLSATEDYYGLVGIGFFEGDEFVGDAGSVACYIPAGAKGMEITISGKLDEDIEAGNYSVLPIISWGDDAFVVGEAVSVTVKDGTSNADLVVQSLAFDKDEYAVGEQVNLVGVLRTLGLGPVYDEVLQVAFFNSMGNQNLAQYSSRVFIEKGVPYSYEFSINPNLPAGDYLVALFKPGDSSYTQASNGIPLKIVEPTGIESLDGESANLILYPQPVTDVLNIRVSSELLAVEVFGLDGQKVITEHLSGMSNDYALSVGHLPNGTYVITVSTKKAVYTEKFVKR